MSAITRYGRRLRRQLANFYAARIDPVVGPPRGLPDVIILGAQRAGTTSLFHWLAQHPAVAPSRTKEVHFFDINFRRGPGWYRYHFPPSSPDRALRLESSPYYLFHPRVPQRVAALVPGARFIVMLRDPVTRAYSHYWHEYRRGREPLSFADALAAEPERLDDTPRLLAEGHMAYSYNHHRYSYFSRGLYAEQIRRWLAHFPRERFLFLESESFFEDPAAGMDHVGRFLGIDGSPDIHFTRENTGGYTSAIDAATEVWLRHHYQEPNRELVDLLGSNMRWTEF